MNTLGNESSFTHKRYGKIVGQSGFSSFGRTIQGRNKITLNSKENGRKKFAKNIKEEEFERKSESARELKERVPRRGEKKGHLSRQANSFRNFGSWPGLESEETETRLGVGSLRDRRSTFAEKEEIGNLKPKGVVKYRVEESKS